MAKNFENFRNFFGEIIQIFDLQNLIDDVQNRAEKFLRRKISNSGRRKSEKKFAEKLEK